MDILLPLCFWLLLVPISKAANDHDHQDCPISKCSDDGPLIQFPFRLNSDPLHCGNPEFEVSCIRSNSSNVTMIRLSSASGLFPIQKIDYENRYFDVYDGDGCLARRLLNFTISSSLFYAVPYHFLLSSRNPNYYASCYAEYPYIDQSPSPDSDQSPYPDSDQSPYPYSDQSPSSYTHCYPYSDQSPSPSPYPDSDIPSSPSPDSDQPPSPSPYPDSDISPSPYSYSDQSSYFYRPFIEFTLLNCSTTEILSRGSSNYIPITCLSVPGHSQVLAVGPSTSIIDLPVSTCTTLKTKFHLPLRSVDGEVHTDRCVPDNVLLLEWKPWSYFPACLNCSGLCALDYRSNQMGCYPAYPYPAPQMDCYPYTTPALDPPQGHASRHWSIIIGVIMAGFVLILAIVLVVHYYVNKPTTTRMEEKENQIKIEKFLDDHKSHVPTRYSYADIKKMTNGFKNKLGEGGFGSVFSGKLPINGVPVAIKVLKDSKGNGDDFVNEVGTIGRIHHVNVVRLLGFSAEEGKRALIYEHMPNRSLEKFIASKDQSSDNTASFDWTKLRNIITGIAKGIEYLHQGCDQRILHFDIKPHNILLDHDFNPKISDFGLAKLCSKEDSVISMTAARGTIGYIAPEVFNGNFGTVSYKSDVYSFGMLVLDVIGARKESSLTSSNSEVYFPELIYKCLIQREELDLELGDDGDARIAKRLAIVALWCIQWYPVNRPSMKAVVRMLEGAFESLIIPPNPFASSSHSEATTTPSS